jgi:hypothetical protein
MALAARVVAGFVVLLALYAGAPAAPSAYAGGLPAHAEEKAGLDAQQLKVVITKVGDGTIQQGRRLVVHGAVFNPGSTHWLDAQAYLQISPQPATTAAQLQQFARASEDPAQGNLIDGYGLFDETMGNVPPGHRVPFTLRVPYNDLGISGDAGVYLVGVKVVAGTSAGRDPNDAAHASTLMPLLPGGATPAPAQTVTLLPLAAPVKRLSEGAFADDSLRTLIAANGRLSRVLDWALLAPPETVQIVIDPALLTAVTDMSDGYRVQAADPTRPDIAGQGSAEAQQWLQKFDAVRQAQFVMFMPWGVPAVNSLLAHRVPGPVIASVAASQAYRDRHARRDFVAGWLTNGSSGIRAVTVLQHFGVDLQIVSQASLPGLASYAAPGGYLPSQVMVSAKGRQIPLMVAATDLAGLPTTPTTSALQFRQRLIADAAVRSLDGRTDVITVTALPFTWNPGPVKPFQGLARAFALPVVVAQSAIGALDGRPATPYHGAVRPSSTAFNALSTSVIEKVHDLRMSGGNLAAILNSANATHEFERVFAMSGSAEWRVFPRIGVQLITAQAADDRAALAKVTITGPPFVAMSSNSGRFPLTVTNGLGRPITVTITVKPADPGLSIEQIAPFQLDAGQRRDVQVVTTAAGSGVTSVRARLATPPPDGARFGRPWRFDVRSTQIGLVIWIVMGVGGAILFIAAGYRILNRIRGNAGGRRQAPA